MSQKVELWVYKIKEGDQDSFEKLFLQFYEPLCKFAWNYVHSTHIAEELVQDIFLHIWESRDSLEPDINMKAYLYQSIRNKALNHQKHQKLAEDYNSKINWLNPSPVTQRHNYDEEPKFEQAVKKAIEDLSKGARTVYKLSRRDGLTYKEIAQVLDISPKTVESQMSRALKKIRQDLKDFPTSRVQTA